MPEDNSAAKLRVFARNADDLAAALHEIHGDRLNEMNANGVEMAIMSQNPPGPQGIREAKASQEYAVRSNNYIAKLVDQAPERFAAFAAVSMHNPDAAVAELTRCVQELHMVGVMLHDAQEYIDSDGTIRELFYDDPKYDVFWAAAESLDVPVYLHPKPPIPQKIQDLYIKRPWLIGPTYSFTSDSSFHALALITSGVFDRYPRLKMILGHMGMPFSPGFCFRAQLTARRLGEMILGHLGRIDHWLDKAHRGRHLPAQRTLREYFETNIFITTAGYFCTPPLLNAIVEIGVSRILFSIDTPYENITEGSTWLDTLPISSRSIEKIGRTNTLDMIPRLKARMRSAEVAQLQKDRSRALWTPQPGFETKARI